MGRYRLIIPDITGENDNIVNGFAAAEKRAKLLLKKYSKYYPCYVAFFDINEIPYSKDFLSMTEDCDGAHVWGITVMGMVSPLYTRLLKRDEKEKLQQLRKL